MPRGHYHVFLGGGGGERHISSSTPPPPSPNQRVSRETDDDVDQCVAEEIR